MLKVSRYTVIESFDDGVLVYNTKNGVQVFVDDEISLQDIRNMENGSFDNIVDRRISSSFCVDSEVNEVQEVVANYYRNFFDPTNLSFIVMPNNVCNFKCIYCYQNHDERHMSKETVANFISAIKRYYEEVKLRRFYIEWFGGEPLISYPTIHAITQELNSFFANTDVNYHYGITTNGYLLNEDTIDFLLSNGFTFFQITLDGGRDNHNKNRPRADGGPTWDKICENLLSMSKKQERFHVSIRVNYNLETFECISELLAYIKVNLDDRFTVFFHNIGKWGGENDSELEVIDYELVPYLQHMLMQEAVAAGVEPNVNYSFFKPYGRICYAGMPYNFTLGSDGKLRKCNEEDSKLDSFNVVGTIENGQIELDVDKWSRFVLPGGSVHLDNDCLECIHLPICFSQSCPKERIQSGAKGCPNDFAMTKEIIRNRYDYLIAKRK